LDVGPLALHLQLLRVVLWVHQRRLLPGQLATPHLRQAAKPIPKSSHAVA
jgi:hypothetical protein